MNTEFFLFLADGEAACAFFDHQRGNSLLTFLRLRIDVYKSRIRCSAVGDPCLSPVDDVRVALSLGLGPEGGGVRAGLRLGERVASDFFPSRAGNEEFLFLLLGAEPQDGVAVERVLNGKNGAGGSADARDFLNDDGVADVIHPRASIIFRHGDSSESQLSGFLEVV